MPQAGILANLWSRKLWVALAAVVAVLVTFASALHAKSVHFGIAEAKVLVDTPRSSVINVGPTSATTNAPPDFSVLAVRGSLLANIVTTPSVRQRIGQAAGLSGGTAIDIEVPLASSTSPSSATPSPSARYALVLSADPNLPIITISSRAPTPQAAVRLANAAVVGVQGYISEVGTQEQIPGIERVTVTPLGPPVGAASKTGSSKKTPVAIFVALFLAECAVIVALARRSRGSAALVGQSERPFPGDGYTIQTTKSRDPNNHTRSRPAHPGYTG